MEPLSIVDLAISVLRYALPEIEKQVGVGKISVEEQEQRLNQLELLRDGIFSGPEWKISTDKPL